MKTGRGPVTSVSNFGGNVRFTVGHYYQPRDETAVLDILCRHAGGKIRVVGSRHSWSEAIVSDQALVDLGHFRDVKIERNAAGEVWATVGGGCTLRRALEHLGRRGVTLPALGLITEQTLAGAISTATHGSGRHSLSHYMSAIRVAAYDHQAGEARIFVYDSGSELRAARCSLGCMGIILSVKLRCIPSYFIAETVQRYATLDEVLAHEAAHPLQQFFLVPHDWGFYVQQRFSLPVHQARRSWFATLYRLYWFAMIDVGLHVMVKLFAGWFRSRRLVQMLYRRILPVFLWKPRRLVERSEVALVMEHELFRHLEIEIFVPAGQLKAATRFVQQILMIFDGAGDLDPADADELQKLGLLSRLEAGRGSFTFHYPVTFRRVLPDDALISMTADASQPYYAISFITFVEPRDAFYRLAQFLAESMRVLFRARLHWGKYFPLDAAASEQDYPHLSEFRDLCRRADPRGVFRNDFVHRVLGPW